MYAEWPSFTESFQALNSKENVLHSFPVDVGREVVGSVVKPLQEMGRGKSFSKNSLTTPEQVHWTMQVIAHGLTLPLSDQVLLNGCIEVYHNWLSALYFTKHTVPTPITSDPNHYAQIIFPHLCALFVPRDGEPRLLEDHAVMCKRVIEILQSLVGMSLLKMARETWSSFFSFLLHVCNQLLAPPSKTPSLGTSLCEMLIHLLLVAWVRACNSSFPSPSLWKSLRELAINWRHHRSVVVEWYQLTYSLTLRVIHVLYGPKHLAHLSSLPDEDTDYRKHVHELSNDAVVQCWFRMLHTLGNPVDLLYPDIITSTPAFQQAFAEGGDSATSPIHSCVTSLPQVFHLAMEGVSSLVYLFLGRQLPSSSLRRTSKGASLHSSVLRSSPSARRKESTQTKSQFYLPTPPAQLRNQDTMYENVFSSGSSSPTPSQKTTDRSVPQPGVQGKPLGNTLLHLFGSWLFESAAWTGQDSEGFSIVKNIHGSSTVVSSVADLSGPSDGTLPVPSTSYQQHRLRDYEAGRAEAFEALCCIFCSRECGEEILPIYLARFYHSLAMGLQYNPKFCSGQVIMTIILNSSSLLHKDLPGINVLVPYFLSALELILPKSTNPFQCVVNLDQLRRASIQLLLSLTPLPFHYTHLPLPDLSGILPMPFKAKPMSFNPQSSLSSNHNPPTFYSLRNKLLELMFVAITVETNATNLQMLLHGLAVYILDLFLYERSLHEMGSELSTELERLTVEDEDQAKAVKNADYSPAIIFHRAISAAHVVLSGQSSGANSNAVTLAALELLSGLARLQLDSLNHTDCRDAVRWVCEFIETQGLQKPHMHSKDLHTSIVAAFRTLLVWIMEHPHLLVNENCLGAILRVTEFGISGSFSQLEDGSLIYKGDKQQKPISGRVREIAEYVFISIMEKIAIFPSPCGAAASGSLMTEEEILKRLPVGKQGKFQYFLVDRSIILGLLEGAFSDKEDSLPMVMAIIRGPAGRQAWSLQLRQHPQQVEPPQTHLHSMPRPKPTEALSKCPNLRRSYWPKEAASCNAGMAVEKSIPSLDPVLEKDGANLHKEITQLSDAQQVAEACVAESQKHDFSSQHSFLEPPKVTKSFDTARLLLSHLELLDIDTLQGSREQTGTAQPSLMLLNSSMTSFRSALVTLDRMPTRFCNSVFILMCRQGQKKMEEILGNQQSLQEKSQDFLDFLHGLGWIVNPVRHPGFSGRLRPESADDGQKSVGACAQIPLRPFPYYADTMTEVAFVLPVLKPSSSDSTSSVQSVESSDSAPESTSLQGEGQPHPSFPTPHFVQTWSMPSSSGVQESSVQAVVGETERHGSFGGRSGKSNPSLPQDPGETPKRRAAQPQDSAAVVVWLERFEDHEQFPIEALSRVLHHGGVRTIRNCLPTVFVHRMSSGMFQIVTRTASNSNSFPAAGPLIDGMVVGKRSLSILVRRTCINLCSRFRMDNEGYSPPHVKRKRKIEEIGETFGKRISTTNMHSDLLIGSHN